MRIASIDIGINGCMAITDEYFLRPTLVDNLEPIITQIPSLLKQEGIKTVVVEEPLYTDVSNKYRGVTGSFVTTWYNFGRLMQTLELVRPQLEIIKVQPRSWQAPIVAGSETKKWSKQLAADYLMAKHPATKGYIYTPREKLIDGRSDALCIADWFISSKMEVVLANKEEPQ